MKRYIALPVLSSLLLAGCLPEAKAKPSAAQQVAAPVQQAGPQAVLSAAPTAPEATRTTLTLSKAPDQTTSVQYHIWRTADGQASKQVIASQDAKAGFPVTLSLQQFGSKRGEYQIEVYKEGTAKPIAASSVVFQPHVPILMYHAVDEYKGKGLKGLFVPPASFEAQMQYLKDNGYTLLTFERWKDVAKVNKPIFVTFDDGMKNNMNAFRILQKLKDEKFQPTATEYAIVNVLGTSDEWLSKQDVKEMIDSGIFSVQSHTISHADLPQIKSYDVELGEAKKQLEAITGKPVISIAYPFGHYNEQVIAEASKYYQFAVTTKPGQFIQAGKPNEMLLMQRVRIQNDTTIEQFAHLVQEKLLP
ncbi:polysaccharide deacetylase family protein [Ectobacillus ponti]|uniref:Polysaccharide deacetylase family protein n=1 Tax=Ectobacillus ponti TaxID=2961894 RepID=A0AA42BQ23_9BACI|nr:polysaccharide deacetylase family protein [Ectobacillus ponti]MCP8969850.1 polysaccharide deacetylase family protein [Ectobacillus ponti]